MNHRPFTPIFFILILTIIVGGCTLLVERQLNQEYGPSSPHNRLDKTTSISTVTFWEDVNPILESRCIVCHGCYDAPCQLDLSAPEGIERGANKELVYNPGRLLAIEPTRLFVDANSPVEWREANFFPVLNERIQTKEANLNVGLMAKMLLLKRQHPLPKVTPLPSSFDFSLDRDQFCPTEEEFNVFAKKNPLWGMPYGLPELPEHEYTTLRTWLEEGAAYGGPPSLHEEARPHISEWETFLNGETLKEQLMSRYLFEHLFLANLYFDGATSRHFFRLVRSRTPPGEPIDFIATRRPFDAPQVNRVFYRLQQVQSTILAKTHMPYVLNKSRRSRFQELFLTPTYEVRELPTYDPATSANPFVTFNLIPAKSRYKFLLDEAQFSIMNFIKGPVCRGQVALSVINERFWIIFGNPDSPALDLTDQFLAKEHHNLRMPTEEQSNASVLQTWRKYSQLEKNYVAGKLEYLKQALPTPKDISLDLIWDGDGQNNNAALTVFRHLNSATVVKGLVGEEPKSIVLLGYPLLERIHYLLVAGYDIYGNIGHQLNSRLYMDFMRMEAEFNFLTLLPEATRVKEWKHWYRDAGGEVEGYGELYNQRVGRQTGIDYQTSSHKSELIGMLKEHLAPVLNTTYEIHGIRNSKMRKQLKRLSQLEGTRVSWLPPFVILSIDGVEGQLFSLIHNNGMSNVSHLFFEDKRRLPEEDSLTVGRGLLGAYPNALFRIAQADFQDFVTAVENLTSEADYRELLNRFGVRRNDPDFWRHSDEIRTTYLNMAPIEAGLLDYNRLENR